MRLLSSRASAVGALLLSLVVTGCETICDEVADEAEAGGCAIGVLPDDVTDEEGEELATCEGDRELRATCLVDNTSNVCSITAEEAVLVDECVAAGPQ